MLYLKRINIIKQVNNLFVTLLRKEIYFLIVVTLFFALPIAIFFIPSEMTQRDMEGHVFTAKFIAEFLYPNYSGWSPFNNLGHPIGSQYPFLVHYLSAFLSKINGDVILWLKILIILAVFFLPSSFFFFVKSIYLSLLRIDTNDKLKSMLSQILGKEYVIKLSYISTFVYIIITMFFPSTIGGTLKATFEIGLITNFIALPFLYFYLGLLFQISNKFNFFAVWISTIILIVILLTHIVSGFIAGLFTLIFCIVNVIKILRSKNYIDLIILKNNPALYIGAGGVLGSMFFYVPYLLNQPFVSEASSLRVDKLMTVSVFLSNIFTIYFLYKIGKTRRSLINAYFFVIAMVILPLLIEVIFNTFQFRLKFGFIHFYRLLPFGFFLLLPMLIVALVGIFGVCLKIRILKFFISKKNINYFINVLPNITNYFLIFLVGGVLVTNILIRNDIRYSGFKIKELNQEIFKSYLGSNILQMYSYNEIYDLHKYPQYRMISKDWKNFTLIGQFEEVGFLNAYANTIPKSIDDTRLTKGIVAEIEKNKELFYIEEKPIKNTNNILLVFELFNIEYLMITDSNSRENCSTEPVPIADFLSRTIENGKLITVRKKILICRYNNSDLSSVVNFENIRKYLPETNIHSKIREIERENWKEAVESWWFEDAGITNILLEKNLTSTEIIEAQKSLSTKPFSGEIIWSKDFQSFQIELPKGIKDFYIIKVQYNPRWVASGNDGQKYNVQRISPSLIGIYTNDGGVINFNYKLQQYELILLYLSLTYILLLLILPILILVFKNQKCKLLSKNNANAGK